MYEDFNKANKTRNEKILNPVYDALIDLKNAVNRKEIPDKVIDIVKENSQL